ncbi:MAG: diguanylate cyclase [Lachnospiraceae bacterium]
MKSKRVKKLMINLFVILCALAMIAVMMSLYFRRVQAMEQERVDHVVHESSVQLVALINQKLNNDMAYIEEISYHLELKDTSITSPETLKDIENRKNVNQAFRSITTATPDGSLYDSNGIVVGNISTQQYFQEAMNGKSAISNIERSPDGSKNIISVAAPIRRNGKVIGIVNGRFQMSELTEFLSAEFFDGQGYSYMANANGNVFVRADHEDADAKFTNIYKGFKPNASVSDATLEKMMQNMQEGKEGQVFYEWDGEKRTLSYMPVGINDWYLLSVLPNKIVSSRTMEIVKQAFIMTGALLVIMMVLLCYLYYQRIKNRKSVERMHEELFTIYNTIPGGVFKCLLDDNFTVTEANEGFYKFLGFTKEIFQTKFNNQLAKIMRPENLKEIKKSVEKQAQRGKTIREEVQLIDVNHQEKWLLINGEVVPSAKGRDLVYSCFTDISELKRVQEELREAKQRYEMVMAQTQDIMFEWNPISKKIIHSRNYEKKFGYQLVEEDFPQSVLREHLVYESDENRFLNIYQRLENGDQFSADEFRIRKKDGHFLWCRISATAVRDKKNQLCRVVGIIEDIDDSKRELEKVIAIAQRDPLTELYNKITTRDLIEDYLHTSGQPAAFLMLDIDDFKNINDTLGHESGDMALIEIANRLKKMFRTSDIVGRMGGDEFVVFLEGLGQEEELKQKLLNISTVLGDKLEMRNQSCSISCSIGVALFPEDGKTFGELFRKADVALYYVKQHGKNGFSTYQNKENL